MTMTPPRKHLALSIDGGGLRGLMVAQALAALEKELGGQPLIKHPSLKILAGSSVGALITTALALGLTTTELIEYYTQASENVFPRLTPYWFPSFLKIGVRTLFFLTRPSMYSSQPLKKILCDVISKMTGTPDFTLGQLSERILRPDQVLLITTTDITERRGALIRSNDPYYADWPLWEAVLASSAAPTYLKPIQRHGRYYADGGVGSFGNPAYLAAREAIDFCNYRPEDVSLFSFGTGWLSDTTFERQYGAPSGWRGIRWAENVWLLFYDEALRAQSLNVIENFMLHNLSSTPLDPLLSPDFTTLFSEQALDFRRFQVELPTDMPMDDAHPNTIDQLRTLGDELGARILNDQHALGQAPDYDPEKLREGVLYFLRQSMSREKVVSMGL